MTTPKTDDGGPAFPIAITGSHETYLGMSLRDYFAGMALQGMYSNPNCNAFGCHDQTKEEAYEIADAMITHRTKQQKEEQK